VHAIGGHARHSIGECGENGGGAGAAYKPVYRAEK